MGMRVARAYSSRLRELWNEPNCYFLDLARKVVPPGDVLVERMNDGGLLMIAAEETFDTGNTQHMAAARSIGHALEGINADEERRWQLLWPARNHRHH